MYISHGDYKSKGKVVKSIHYAKKKVNWKPETEVRQKNTKPEVGCQNRDNGIYVYNIFDSTVRPYTGPLPVPRSAVPFEIVRNTGITRSGPKEHNVEQQIELADLIKKKKKYESSGAILICA